MTEFIGKEEKTLKAMLDESLDFEERRKIRAAMRDLRNKRFSTVTVIMATKETPRQAPSLATSHTADQTNSQQPFMKSVGGGFGGGEYEPPAHVLESAHPAPVQPPAQAKTMPQPFSAKTAIHSMIPLQRSQSQRVMRVPEQDAQIDSKQAAISFLNFQLCRNAMHFSPGPQPAPSSNNNGSRSLSDNKANIMGDNTAKSVVGDNTARNVMGDNTMSSQISRVNAGKRSDFNSCTSGLRSNDKNQSKVYLSNGNILNLQKDSLDNKIPQHNGVADNRQNVVKSEQTIFVRPVGLPPRGNVSKPLQRSESARSWKGKPDTPLQTPKQTPNVSSTVDTKPETCQPVSKPVGRSQSVKLLASKFESSHTGPPPVVNTSVTAKPAISVTRSSSLKLLSPPVTAESTKATDNQSFGESVACRNLSKIVSGAFGKENEGDLARQAITRHHSLRVAASKSSSQVSGAPIRQAQLINNSTSDQASSDALQYSSSSNSSVENLPDNYNHAQTHPPISGQKIRSAVYYQPIKASVAEGVMKSVSSSEVHKRSPVNNSGLDSSNGLSRSFTSKATFVGESIPNGLPSRFKPATKNAQSSRESNDSSRFYPVTKSASFHGISKLVAVNMSEPIDNEPHDNNLANQISSGDTNGYSVKQNRLQSKSGSQPLSYDWTTTEELQQTQKSANSWSLNSLMSPKESVTSSQNIPEALTSSLQKYEDVSDEKQLQKMLADCTELDERIQIRAALRKLKQRSVTGSTGSQSDSTGPVMALLPCGAHVTAPATTTAPPLQTSTTLEQNKQHLEQIFRQSFHQPNSQTQNQTSSQPTTPTLLSPNTSLVSSEGNTSGGSDFSAGADEYATVSDPLQLQNLLNQTEDYFERKKIRTALTALKRRNSLAEIENQKRRNSLRRSASEVAVGDTHSDAHRDTNRDVTRQVSVPVTSHGLHDQQAALDSSTGLAELSAASTLSDDVFTSSNAGQRSKPGHVRSQGSLAIKSVTYSSNTAAEFNPVSSNKAKSMFASDNVNNAVGDKINIPFCDIDLSEKNSAQNFPSGFKSHPAENQSSGHVLQSRDALDLHSADLDLTNDSASRDLSSPPLSDQRLALSDQQQQHVCAEKRPQEAPRDNITAIGVNSINVNNLDKNTSSIKQTTKTTTAISPAGVLVTSPGVTGQVTVNTEVRTWEDRVTGTSNSEKGEAVVTEVSPMSSNNYASNKSGDLTVAARHLNAQHLARNGSQNEATNLKQLQQQQNTQSTIQSTVQPITQVYTQLFDTKQQQQSEDTTQDLIQQPDAVLLCDVTEMSRSRVISGSAGVQLRSAPGRRHATTNQTRDLDGGSAGKARDLSENAFSTSNMADRGGLIGRQPQQSMVGMPTAMLMNTHARIDRNGNDTVTPTVKDRSTIKSRDSVDTTSMSRDITNSSRDLKMDMNSIQVDNTAQEPLPTLQQLNETVKKLQTELETSADFVLQLETSADFEARRLYRRQIRDLRTAIKEGACADDPTEENAEEKSDTHRDNHNKHNKHPDTEADPAEEEETGIISPGKVKVQPALHFEEPIGQSETILPTSRSSTYAPFSRDDSKRKLHRNRIDSSTSGRSGHLTKSSRGRRGSSADSEDGGKSENAKNSQNSQIKLGDNQKCNANTSRQQSVETENSDKSGNVTVVSKNQVNSGIIQTASSKTSNVIDTHSVHSQNHVSDNRKEDSGGSSVGDNSQERLRTENQVTNAGLVLDLSEIQPADDMSLIGRRGLDEAFVESGVLETGSSDVIQTASTPREARSVLDHLTESAPNELTIVDPLSDIIGIDGESVILRCRLRFPANCDVTIDDVIVTWQQDVREIQPSAEFVPRISFEESDENQDGGLKNKNGGCRLCLVELYIVQVFPDDEGKYSCRVKLPSNAGNEEQEVESSCYLLVKENDAAILPRFARGLADTEVRECSKLVLGCEVSGVPTPRIYWYYSSIMIKRSNVDFVQSYDGRVASLHVAHVLSTDAGQYTCAAKNAAGEVRCSCTLRVTADEDDNEQSEGEDTIVELVTPTTTQTPDPSDTQSHTKPDTQPDTQSHIQPDTKPVTTSISTADDATDGALFSKQKLSHIGGKAWSDKKSQETKLKNVTYDKIGTASQKHVVGDSKATGLSGQKVVTKENKMASTPTKQVHAAPMAESESSGEEEAPSSPDSATENTKTGAKSVHNDSKLAFIASKHSSNSEATPIRISGLNQKSQSKLTSQQDKQVKTDTNATSKRAEQTLFSNKLTTSSAHPDITSSVVKKVSTAVKAEVVTADIQEVTSSIEPEVKRTVVPEMTSALQTEEVEEAEEAQEVEEAAEEAQEVEVDEEEVEEAPEVRMLTEELLLSEGDALTLTCHVNGQPTPSVTWSRDGDELVATRDLHLEHENGVVSLTVPRLTPAHSGMYECAAKNIAGSAGATASVTVRAKHTSTTKQSEPISVPRLTRPFPATETLTLEAPFCLECHFLSHSHKTTVTWYKDGIELPRVGRLKWSTERSFTRLWIARASRGDVGTFRVVISNTAGRVESTCGVHVQGAMTGATPPTTPSSTTVQQGVFTFEGQRKKLQPKQVDEKASNLLSNVLDNLMTSETRGQSRADLKQTISGQFRSSGETQQKHKPIIMTDKDIDKIEDEELLHSMLNTTENFDERKKIRARLRDIRELKTAEYEARRIAREAEREGAVKLKHRLAEEQRARQKQTSVAKTTVANGGSTTGVDSVKERQQRAEKEKQMQQELYKEQAKTASQAYQAGSDIRAKLDLQKAEELKVKDAQRRMSDVSKGEETTVESSHSKKTGPEGKSTTDVTTTTTKTKDGSKTVTHQTKTVTQVTRTGGSTVSIQNSSAVSAKSGPRGAMAAFQQMDESNAKPNATRVTVARSPSTIKQIMLDWCAKQVQGYEHVNITNFSSSWNDGMAFCALIHHFHPEAFDYAKLDPKKRRANFALAFHVAEKYADIAPLLDVEDMVRMKNPDWKCVFTYVQSFFRKFNQPPHATPPSS